MTPPNKYHFVIPQYHCVCAIFKVAPHVWITLLLVWIVVVVSVLQHYEEPASGAVLVGGALIAETMFERLAWRKLHIGEPNGSVQLKGDSHIGNAILKGNFVSAPAHTGRLGALLSLAKDHDLRIESNNYSHWYYYQTVERVEKIFLSAIIATAFVGTALWGYGHLLYPVESIGKL